MAHPLPNPDPPDAPDHAPEPPAPLALLPAYEEVRESLMRTLALDRLRDLHYDGVTMDYIGRMYGVSGECVQELEGELRRDRHGTGRNGPALI